MADDAEHLKGSLRLLVGFLVGCLVVAVAVSFAADWAAWRLPVILADGADLLVLTRQDHRLFDGWPAWLLNTPFNT